MTFELNSIAQVSAAGIADCLLEGTLIALFASLMLRAARRQDSGTRFALLFAALMVIAVAPFAGRAWAGASGAASHSSFSRAWLTLPGSWAVYALGLWSVIAAWGLARVGLGLWHVHVLRRSCVPVDVNLLDLQLRQTLKRNSFRGVELCVSDQVQVPTAIGLVRPAVVIPEWVMQELSAAELDQILLHELAHLRRWDDWTNLAQKIVKALFFFHPAVWWIEKKISLEREMACDDAVLAQTANPRAYAECLAHLAEKTFIQRSIALAQAALGKMRQTSQRVAQILDGNRNAQSGRGWRVAVPLVAGFAVVCVAGISRAPRLVAFSDAGESLAPTVARVSFDADSRIVIPATRVGLRISAKGPQGGPQGKRNSAPQFKHALSTAEPSCRKEQSADRVLAADAMPPPMAEMMRLAKLSAAPPIAAQAVYVVFEGREIAITNGTVYEIRVWHLVVFHPVVDPDKKVPAKQT